MRSRLVDVAWTTLAGIGAVLAFATAFATVVLLLTERWVTATLAAPNVVVWYWTAAALLVQRIQAR